MANRYGVPARRNQCPKVPYARGQGQDMIPIKYKQRLKYAAIKDY
jgi:hypothetical protein